MLSPHDVVLGHGRKRVLGNFIILAQGGERDWPGRMPSSVVDIGGTGLSGTATEQQQQHLDAHARSDRVLICSRHST